MSVTDPLGERLTAAEWFDLPDGAIVHLPAFSGWTTVIVRGGYCDVIDAYSAAEVGERYARTTLAPRDLGDESPRLLVHMPPPLRYARPESNQRNPPEMVTHPHTLDGECVAADDMGCPPAKGSHDA